MRVNFITIVLDGMPFITQHIHEMARIQADWTWHIVEGAAMNHHDTAWCRPQRPRLSEDGTTQYLDGIASHPRVRLYRRASWDGKREMVNEPLATIKEPCVIFQRDVDEFWRAEQVDAIVSMMSSHSDLGALQFRCNYHVGPNLVSVVDGTYGNRGDEWQRVWRYQPGARFLSHEPPNLPVKGRTLRRHETAAMGLVFDHYAYALEKQVAGKEAYYGYRKAVDQWRRLQAHNGFPCRLRDFLPWVDDGAMVDRRWR